MDKNEVAVKLTEIYVKNKNAFDYKLTKEDVRNAYIYFYDNA